VRGAGAVSAAGGAADGMGGLKEAEPMTALPANATRSAVPLPVDGAAPLRRNAAWMFAGTAVYAGCQWGCLAALAKLGTPAVVGLFALGLAVAAPLLQFAGLQLRAVQATDAAGAFAFGDYLGLTLLTTGLAVVLLGGASLAFGGEAGLTVLLVGVGKGFDGVGEAFFGLLQKRERLDRVARSLAVNGVLSLALLGAAVALTGSAAWAAGGWALASALTLCGCTIPAALDSGPLRPRWRARRLLRLAWLALPLGFVLLLLSLNANLPRYFLERSRGAAELGVFAAAAYLVVVGNTAVAALGQSASPSLARCYESGDLAAYRGLLLRLLSAGALAAVVVVLAAVAAGPPLLALLYTPEYAADGLMIVWLAVAAGLGFVSSFLGYAMTAARRFRVQAALFGVVTVVTAAASALLIPRHGARGAALTLLAAAAVQLLGSAAVVIDALCRGPRRREAA